MIKYSTKFMLLTSLLFVLIASSIVPVYHTAGAEGLPSTPSFDAMFVLDTSGSMTLTDPDNTAAEVIHMLMDMSAAERTRVGYVAYNHTIVDAKPLTDISVKEKRTRLKADIESLRRRGSTDVGLGLLRGTTMLSKQQKEGSKAFVVLLSDGATDISSSSSKRTLKNSENDVSSAIKLAQEKGYPIYTVGLNHDGSVNEAELARIAEETGGKSYKTSSAEDLPEIFNQIYADQVQSILNPVAALTATGKLQDVPVTIANSSMNEANIVLISERPISETQLFYQSNNVRMYNSNKYTILKIASPEKGTFSLKFRGSSGDLIKIYILSNYEFHADASMAKEPVKGQPTRFEAQLLHTDGSKLNDADVYQSVKAMLTIRNQETKQEQQVDMKVAGTLLEADYSFNESANYSWSMRLEGPDFYRLIPGSSVAVSNLPPETAGLESITMKKQDGSRFIALDTLFVDPNLDALTFSIVSDKNSKHIAAELADGQLILSPQQLGSTTIEIQAADTEGAAVTKSITVEIKSAWTKYIPVVLIVIAAIIAAIALYLWLRPKPSFTGRLEGYFLNTASGNEIPITHWPLTSFAQRSISLLQLFRSLDINEQLPEAANIVFHAGKGGTLIVTHRTRCTLVRGKHPVQAGVKEPIQFGEKLYITFEDGITEIELRYKPIKPNTNIFTRPE